MDNQPVVSVRGLEKQRSFNPLKEFTGIFDELTTESIEGERGSYIRVHLKFTDVEVILSDEPYDFPIADITISYNKREKSNWGVFSNSLVKHLVGNQDIDDALKSRLHMKVTPGHMQWDMQEKKELPKDCWEVVEIVGKVAGASKKDGLARALEILDGKDIKQFNQLALQDPTVRADTTVQPLIMNRKFIPQMIESGAVSVDGDGIHHVTVTS